MARWGLGPLILAASLAGACVPEDIAVTAAPPAAERAPQAAAAAAPPAAGPVPEAAVAAPETLLDTAVYGARQDAGRTIAAIDVARYNPALLRNRVPFQTGEAPGSIVIDTGGPFLYLVEPGGTATRYGIAIGREGFGWTGSGRVARTARWPGWTPPPEMIRREPQLAKWAGGMPGGVDNPLGARALYIYFGGSDSGYRIHGTNQPGSIGRAASSGCFRMLNQDVIDLYDRIAVGATVVVR